MLQMWFKRMWEPQHFYVIHVDAKSPISFYESVRFFSRKYSFTFKVYSLTRDHKNVVINPDRYYTIKSGWTVLWHHISNFMHALKVDQARDYFINVEEFSYPIKTTNEINYFLGEYMGMSFMEEDCIVDELRQVWVDWTWMEVKNGVIVASKGQRVRPILQLRYSDHPVILHRGVVEWMFDDSHALHVLYWLRNTKAPTEVYYSTILNASPFKSSLWNRNNFVFTTTTCCPGIARDDSSCVLGMCNLPEVLQTNKLFATLVDIAIDSEFILKIDQELDRRKVLEEETKTVNRVPLHASQISDPDVLPL